MSGQERRRTDKEEIVQRMIRMLAAEYRFPLEAMARDVAVPVNLDGRRRTRSADLVVYRPGQLHELPHTERIIVVQPPGTKPTDATRGIDLLKDVRASFGGPTTRRNAASRQRLLKGDWATERACLDAATGSLEQVVEVEPAPADEQPSSAPPEPTRVLAAGAGVSSSEAAAVSVPHQESGSEVGLGSPGEAEPESEARPLTVEPAAGEAAAATPLEQSEPAPEEAGPEYAVLIGDTRPSPQVGLLGAVAAEPWRRVALDLNGCNTVSVFGVQGSGKSYTVGSVIEMATMRLPGLNLLPRPLGAVVFHYHQTQDYPPEFVAMAEPNDSPDEVAALAEWSGVPAALEDVLVLTTADTINLRRREFPRATVEPIAFASAELTVADWRFLMGATGSDALYLKLVSEAMRKQRTNLTLEGIRAALAQAPLSEAHRTLVETRLDFASRFIDDSRSLRSLLRPGRLVVVDLRDESVEKEQALGLFVTMLNVFSGAGLGGESFNKLIVFDEAHKYMGGGLIGHVVEVIREMRHKGLSVLIASQDPVNVPPAVIELSSAVILHRFNSPNWLRHVQKSLAALGDLTASMLASLLPGEGFVWANRATDPTFTRRAVKVRMRPRATKHGGSTRTAVQG